MGKTERQIIREGLRDFHGSIPLIAKRSESIRDGGFSLSMIRMVLDGRKTNTKLLTFCGEMLIELKENKKKLDNNLTNVVRQIQSL